MILINTLLLSFGYLVVAEEFTRSRHVPISLKTTDDLFLIAHGPEIIFKLGLPFDALSIRFLIVIVEPVSIADDEAHTPVTLLVVAENLICGVLTTTEPVGPEKSTIDGSALMCEKRLQV